MEKNFQNRILPFLYEANSIPEALSLYENFLATTGNPEDIIHRNAIKSFRRIVENKSFVAVLQKNFNVLLKLMDKDFPDTTFHMEGRRKSVLSAEAKILLYLSLNRSLDEVRDFYAFRIILFKNDLDVCYKLADRLIDLMASRGFTPCESTEKINVAKAEIPEGILVPKKSLLNRRNKNLVKDYVLNPKESGYQSLHIVFRDSLGRCFEVQIRTLAMHAHAESSENASHETYKQSRYSGFYIELDRSKVHMDGFFGSGSKLYDYIGLENGLRILQRQKTF